MEETFVLEQSSFWTRKRGAKIFIYPAIADGVDLPELCFCKNANEETFILRRAAESQAELDKAGLCGKAAAFDAQRLKSLFVQVFPDYQPLRVILRIIDRRAPVLKIIQDGNLVSVEAHWNLLLPYFYTIKELPIIHAEIMEVFARAVFFYASVAVKQAKTAKNELRRLVIEGYRNNPALLLASLDIFNKFHIYHIRPTKVWQNAIFAANDAHRLEIDVSAIQTNLHLPPELLEELTCFLHKIVKNYAFRYVDYLWTERYKLIWDEQRRAELVSFQNGDIVINIALLLARENWKPAFYLNIGYAIMLAILVSSGKEKNKETIYVAAMKTWNRYLSYDESVEQQSAHEIFGWPVSSLDEKCRGALQSMTGQEDSEFINDFILLKTYSSKETFLERLNVLSECLEENKTGIYCEQLWNKIKGINASLVRDNINYSNFIEILRDDNIDHHQLKELLNSGRLNGRYVVDVSEWLLLRTLLYDLINTPKVFRNDYKMLLKVLTKVNKSLIAYIWTLGINQDPRYERVSAYISKLMSDIFVFNRIKVYEIVAEPEECLESEAVAGYLLNWAALQPEQRRLVIEKIISKLPRSLIEKLSVRNAGDVDYLFKIITFRTSGIFGFYLHQAYQWGSMQEPLTEKIRTKFPELLQLAQSAIVPSRRVMQGAMVLLPLAQIISDQRDGYAPDIVITEEERQVARNLIKQCIHWDQMHYVIMIAGIAAGYMGDIDEWVLQQFYTLLGRYDAGDRVVLRSVVQFDIENLISRAFLTTKEGEENILLNKLQLLRDGADPAISSPANKFLKESARRCGINLPRDAFQKKDIRKPVLAILQCLRK